MQYLPLNNIFNYITSYIRNEENDDDQLKSWALQGLKKINIPNLRTIRKHKLISLANHNAVLSNDMKEIIAVFLYTDSSTSIVDEEYQNLITASDDLMLDYWQPLREVELLDKSYFDGSTVTDQYVYCVQNQRLTSSVLEGVLYIKYRSYLTDDCDDILIVERPEMLWQYMASYSSMMHFRNQKDRRIEGSSQLYQQYQMETSAYLTQAKREIIGSNIDIVQQKMLMYGESMIARIPQQIINEHHD